MRRNGSRRPQALRVLRRIHDRWDGDLTSTRGVRVDTGLGDSRRRGSPGGLMRTSRQPVYHFVGAELTLLARPKPGGIVWTGDRMLQPRLAAAT